MIRGPDWTSIAIRLIFLILLVGGGIYLYQRYEILSLDKGDDSMQVVRRLPKPDERDVISGFPKGTMVLVDLKEKISRTDCIAYEEVGADMDDDWCRIGRVFAVPGDRIANSSNGFTVNGIALSLEGRLILRFPNSLTMHETMPEDQYLVINDNPDSKMSDSRNLGAIPKERIRGKVLRSWPW